MSEIIGFPPQEGTPPPSEGNPNEDDKPLSPAAQILYHAAILIDGERDNQHGDRHENIASIARSWTAFTNEIISPRQAALMMAEMKIARTQHGEHNLDDYIDACGYIALASELSDNTE